MCWRDMKIYFYTLKQSQCGKACDYRSCSCRYLARLQSGEPFKELLPLCGSFPFSCKDRAKVPQSGDLMILYARDGEELMGMNKCRESFEGFKKVLVVKDSTGIDSSMYHHLAPRYITHENRDVEELAAVVEKMKMSVDSIF